MHRLTLPILLTGLIGAMAYVLAAPETPTTQSLEVQWVGPARVTDGDTIRIGDTRIRLHGVDTPEASQDCRTEHGFPFACGDVATDVLNQLIGTASVTCTHIEYDRYDRSVARCYLGGADIGQTMVAAGYAVAYRRYSTEYVTDEEAARAQGLGLWSANMQTPATYRQIANQAPPAPDPTCAIKGNISENGQIFHVPGQEFYDRTRINEAAGERWFCSEAEATAAGWRRAGR